MNEHLRPNWKAIQDQERQAAIDEAIGDCTCVARLIVNELGRDAWNIPNQDVETLHFLARQMVENLQELEVRVVS